MTSLTNFKAVYCSGIYVPEAATVSALSLLFERVYLPRNWTVIEEFARKYSFVGKLSPLEELFQQVFEKRDPNFRITSVNWKQSDGSEPFPRLTPTQRQTAFLYVLRGHQFAKHYESLFREVFETNVDELGDATAVQGELIAIDVQKPNKTKAIVSLSS